MSETVDVKVMSDDEFLKINKGTFKEGKTPIQKLL